MTVEHIAFIMDGNRRYAKKNGYSLEIAYRKGMEKFLEFVSYQIKHKVPITTFFALSKDNHDKRPLQEKEILISLMENFSKNKDLEKFFFDNKVQINVKGNLRKLKTDEDLKGNLKFKYILKKFENYSKNVQNPNFIVNIALNYDGQEEIVYSVNEILNKIKNNEISSKKITANMIKKHLFFSDTPEPNIIVRPGNVPRTSGFMLWDSQYSEIYLSNKLWPELNEGDFISILDWYQRISRNFGK